MTVQAVSGWIHGRGRPSPRIMKILEDDESIAIPMREWLEEELGPAPEQATGTDAKVG